MPHHRDMGIADRPDDPLSHRLLIGRESGMHRGDNIIECRENLVREIEISLLEDIALGPREEPEACLLEFLGGVELADLGYLLCEA